ncbi:MAG: hypothetical protein JSS78_11920 [Bacteroidetes bacterium]|nr:hypothetical protein [Bacteroidota bacterium]
MRRYSLLATLAFSCFAFSALQSCKRSNGIDNNSVIKTPYGLLVGSNAGALLNTNDGTNYTMLFPNDRFPFRAITTSGSNILFVKSNVHLSENNGHNFNPTYVGYVPPSAHWQNVIWTAEDQSRVYLCSTEPSSNGIVYSENDGKKWKNDAWDQGTAGGMITSITQLKNGTLFAFSDINDSLYRKDNKTANWTHTMPGVQMPAGTSYLSRFNNTLLLTDYLGVNGVQYSNDNGQTWSKYMGTPVNAKLLCTNAPMDMVLLVGTDSMGVYRLENGVFVQSNTGLENNTSVYAIAGKADIYKNDLTKRYIYLATNKGVYRSEDGGFNWALMLTGDFGALY